MNPKKTVIAALIATAIPFTAVADCDEIVVVQPSAPNQSSGAGSSLTHVRGGDVALVRPLSAN